MYSGVIWEHFGNPKNVGKLENPDAKGIAGTPHSGPFFILTMNFENGVVSECQFKTYGCAPAIAAGSLLTELLKGKGLQECQDLTLEELVEELGGVPSDKMHCPRLALDALNDALKNLDESQEGA